MKFGVREICNVVFKAKTPMKIGNTRFAQGQPVLYIDTATTSSMEGAATTVYAKGGRGYTNLVAWEGEKTLTFTVEDALLSPVGFAILSGAGLIEKNKKSEIHVHVTTMGVTDGSGVVEVDEKICTTAPVFVMGTEGDGSLTGEVYKATVAKGKLTVTNSESEPVKNQPVFIDYYVVKTGDKAQEIQIDAEKFAGYFYVEADTLFRRQEDGKDLPANITFPNVKIQSNFTFTMAASGDPSTFSFTMDAFPGYTMFNKTRKVLCVIQVIDDPADLDKPVYSVMEHKNSEEFKIEDAGAEKPYEDSVEDVKLNSGTDTDFEV